MADLALARKVLQTEAAAILALVPRIDERFDRAVEMLHECRGRVITTGIGKSGIICQKIAATLSSTGTAAFFLHPAEALHGDLGVVQADDVVMAISYSGETEEILRLLETIRRVGAKLIAITGGCRAALPPAGAGGAGGGRRPRAAAGRRSHRRPTWRSTARSAKRPVR